MKKLIYFVLAAILSASCGDFLQEYSKELVYANSCSDLDEVLIGNGYMTTGTPVSSYNHGSLSDGKFYYPWLQVMDDDIEEFASGKYSLTTGSVPLTSMRGWYSWQPDPFLDYKGIPYDDPNWKKLYEHIGYLNVVISLVDTYDDPVELRNRVKGEAEFLRGAYYFLLVNMYAKPYVKATAEKEPGVALNLTEEIEDQYFKRNSIAEVYDVIVRDLKAAAEHLKGIEQPTKYRVNEKAARILLSRVYLYMGEWQLALEECERALALGCRLEDLNRWDLEETYTGGAAFMEKKQYLNDVTSDEVVFTQGTNIMHLIMYDNGTKTMTGIAAGRYSISSDLLAQYSQYEAEQVEDLRLKGYFSASLRDGNRYLVRKTHVLVARISTFDSFIIRTAEVWLNKAEAQAMLGQEAEALATLKELMAKRFLGEKLPASIDGLQGQALVQLIRSERRRELCFESQRWFDLRRYAVSEKYPESKEIIHPVYAPGATSADPGVYEGDYRLKPYAEDAAAYVMPIPGYEIEYNKGNLVENPARPERNMGE